VVVGSNPHTAWLGLLYVARKRCRRETTTTTATTKKRKKKGKERKEKKNYAFALFVAVDPSSLSSSGIHMLELML
jgi:hypothetical protein